MTITHVCALLQGLSIRLMFSSGPAMAVDGDIIAA